MQWLWFAERIISTWTRTVIISSPISGLSLVVAFILYFRLYSSLSVRLLYSLFHSKIDYNGRCFNHSVFLLHCDHCFHVLFGYRYRLYLIKLVLLVTFYCSFPWWRSHVLIRQHACSSKPLDVSEVLSSIRWLVLMLNWCRQHSMLGTETAVSFFLERENDRHSVFYFWWKRCHSGHRQVSGPLLGAKF